jgi:hypothetical protein
VTGATAEFAERLARRRRLGVVLLWSGILLIPATVLAFLRLDEMYSARQSRLVPWYRGTIVSVLKASDDDDGTVTVEYRDGGLQDRDVHVDDTSDWPIDSRATLLVDPSDPTVMTLRGENYLPGWFPLAAFMAPTLAVALASVGAGLRSTASMARKRLTRGSWRRSDALVAPAGDGFVIYLPDVDGGSFWTTDKHGKRLGSPVDVAGGFETGIVLREVGGNRFVLAQPGGRGRCVEVEHCWWSTEGRAVAVRVAAGDESWKVEVPDESLAATLVGRDGADVELRLGPRNVAALIVGADRNVVVGKVVPAKRARWPKLELR